MICDAECLLDPNNDESKSTVLRVVTIEPPAGSIMKVDFSKHQIFIIFVSKSLNLFPERGGTWRKI
jgi:hypothetical protein